MPWSAIQVAEVLEEFTPAEAATLQNIQQSDTSLPGILRRVVRAARGSISAGGNPLDTTAETIPDQIRDDVVALARWKWLTGFPALKSMQTKGRADAAAAAQTRLDNIASGDIKVELPPSATSASAPTQRPSFGTRGNPPVPSRDFTPENQDG